MSNITRKLASIRKISDIKPIPDADAIEVATVDGWRVVIKKGEFKIGDLAVYFEIDSWIPHELAPFLSKGAEPREYNGVKGERLRTVKLRGTISQGLLIPIYGLTDYKEGDDVTEVFNIQKWNPPAPTSMDAAGQFPLFVPRTDQERIQNVYHTMSTQEGDAYKSFEATLKLDGSSMTVYKYDSYVGVCSRNLELKEGENAFWNTAKKYNLIEILKSYDGHNIALQGELMGPGVQKNREQFKEHKFFIFDIFDIDEYRYFSPKERRDFVESMGLLHVPVIETDMNVFDTFKSVDDFLAYADRKSINHKVAEGVVFKSNYDPSVSFKAISNRFLLAE